MKSTFHFITFFPEERIPLPVFIPCFDALYYHLTVKNIYQLYLIDISQAGLAS